MKRNLAAHRSTSVSRLVAAEIECLVQEDDRYQKARATAVRQLERGFRLGGGHLADRGSLHER
jgi:hypothetical protein